METQYDQLLESQIRIEHLLHTCQAQIHLLHDTEAFQALLELMVGDKNLAKRPFKLGRVRTSDHEP